MDVDAAVTVPVNLLPLIAVADFKTVLAAETYNEAGLELIWNFVTLAGVQTHVAVTPSNTGGDYDWVAIGHGMYNIEIPASGGASANNDTEGFGWFTGVATDALPWRGPVIGFRRAALNDLLIEGSTASTNLEDFFDGTGYAGGTAKLQVDLVKILGTALTETSGQIAAAFKKLFDVGTPVLTLDAAGMNIIADAVLVRNWASVTYTGTVRCALTALQAVRNKFTAAAGAGGYSVKKENDSTESWAATLTIDGDGNITAMDPDS
jgi:hypothetical protein